MTLLNKISEDLNNSLREGNSHATSTLRLLLSSIKNAKIARGRDLSDEEILDEVAKEVKRHKESIAAFEKGKRTDLAEKEKKELEVLQIYLPAQLPDEEIAKIIDEAITQTASAPADFGKVMGTVMAKVKGRADGDKVSAIVREKLSQ